MNVSFLPLFCRLAIALTTALAIQRASADEPKYGLSDEINRRFSEEPTIYETAAKTIQPVFSFSRSIEIVGERHCAISFITSGEDIAWSRARSTATLREEQMLAELATAEKAIDEDMAIDDRKVQVRLSPLGPKIFPGHKSQIHLTPGPEPSRNRGAAPKTSDGPEKLIDLDATHVAVTGVAMRFRDEQPMVFGGMTFVR